MALAPIYNHDKNPTSIRQRGAIKINALLERGVNRTGLNCGTNRLVFMPNK